MSAILFSVSGIARRIALPPAISNRTQRPTASSEAYNPQRLANLTKHEVQTVG